MREYVRPFRVRYYELDSFNHLNQSVYADYLQQTAIEASADACFTPEWYAAQNSSWVVRKLEIRYHQQASANDELEVRTWVSDVRRITSRREYEITRKSDNTKMLRARANWVYVNRETLQPQRIPEIFKEQFQPNGVVEDLGIRVSKPELTTDTHRYVRQRRVQVRELDISQHVNHVVYLSWIEQAYFDAMRSAGYPVTQTRNDGWFAFQGGHEIEYFEPAFDNDEIEIVSWVCEMGKVRGAWTHEIYNAVTKRLLARDYSLGVFVNEKGRPIAAPTEIVKDILSGKNC